MTYIEMAQKAKEYGATVSVDAIFTLCRPQRRWKYGYHSSYMHLRRTVKG